MTRLEELDVVLVDCQATASSPARGHLLEVAWCRARANEPAEADKVRSSLVALPAGVDLPSRIARLTGIDAAALEEGRPVEEVLGLLQSEASGAVLVAHAARLESAFLQPLLEREDTLGARIICTHAIARRLLPDLPSRGLRALAGYFGHVVPEPRRAGSHVAATALVWRELLKRLRAEGVGTLADLDRYLESAPRRAVGRRLFPLARFRRQRLPNRPGVYRMLGPSGEVLYVGKATSLSRRVNGYFRKRHQASPRTSELLTQVRDIDVTATATALEAALLEVQEIQRLAPPYNVALRTAPAGLADDASDLPAELLRQGRRTRAGRHECDSVPPDDPSRVAAEASRAVDMGRWLCWLSESSLGFSESGRAPGRLLMFHRGVVIEARDLARGLAVPEPPGAARTLPERRLDLEARAFRLLRVLTSEIRRLLGGTDEILLVLGKGRRLGPHALRKLMAWL